MDGYELALRFSYITNLLRFCGPDGASSQFIRYLKKKDNSKEVEESLRRFEGLYPYLSAIASKSSRQFTDYEVVEAYWIGNPLLELFGDEDIRLIIKSLMQRGLPSSIGQRLLRDIPHGFVPHHNFNVFYVGVGNTTGSVETTLSNMDNCRISWGSVIERSGDTLFVNVPSLKKSDESYCLGESETKTVVFLPEMIGHVKKGDIVALHWGFAAMILNENQLNNLKRYTLSIFDVLNTKLKKSHC